MDTGKRHWGQGAAGRTVTQAQATGASWAKPPSRLQSGEGRQPPQKCHLKPLPLPRLPSPSTAALIACQDSGICPVCRRKQEGSGLHQPWGSLLMLQWASCLIMRGEGGGGWGGRRALRLQADTVGTEQEEGCLVFKCPHSPGTGAQRLHPCHMTGCPPGCCPGSLSPGSAWSCCWWVLPVPPPPLGLR